MNVNSGGPHILLFERDQQLTTLLSSELAQAGYEVHTARTAVEVFDAIARFPVRLVMVDLAQAQAGRREFWVALDAQRRGRGVQVFTFRCTNLGGYGPDDPDERVETVLTDMEVDGAGGAGRLVEAVRARVPGATVTSAPARTAPVAAEASYQNSRPVEAVMPPIPQASPIYQQQPQAAPVYQQQAQAAPVYQAPRQASPIYQPLHQASPVYQSAPLPAVAPAPQASPVYQPAPQPAVAPQASSVYQPPVPPQPAPQPQAFQVTYRPQIPENYAPPAPQPQPARAEELPRARSTFTDKIRAVFYPSSQSFSSVSETSNQAYAATSQGQHAAPYQNPDAQPRARASQRFAEAEYPTTQTSREEMLYQAQPPAAPAQQSYTSYAGFAPGANSPVAQPAPAVPEESGLDQLSRLLRESQPTPQNTVVNGYAQSTAFRSPVAQEQPEIQEFRPQNAIVHGNAQNPTVRPGLTIDPQEIQDFRAQILQAARLDEAQERSNTGLSRVVEASSASAHLRASPIQDIPFEQEVSQRRGPVSAVFPPEASARPAMTIMQPTQGIPQTPQQAQPSFADAPTFTGSGTQP
ncbi:MAG TPA: hypothetical protein VF458_09850, partial [Ktedonobacteraceae bacterium]